MSDVVKPINSENPAAGNRFNWLTGWLSEWGSLKVPKPTIDGLIILGFLCVTVTHNHDAWAQFETTPLLAWPLALALDAGIARGGYMVARREVDWPTRISAGFLLLSFSAISYFLNVAYYQANSTLMEVKFVHTFLGHDATPWALGGCFPIGLLVASAMTSLYANNQANRKDKSAVAEAVAKVKEEAAQALQQAVAKVSEEMSQAVANLEAKLAGALQNNHELQQWATDVSQQNATLYQQAATLQQERVNMADRVQRLQRQVDDLISASATRTAKKPATAAKAPQGGSGNNASQVLHFPERHVAGGGVATQDEYEDSRTDGPGEVATPGDQVGDHKAATADGDLATLQQQWHDGQLDSAAYVEALKEALDNGLDTEEYRRLATEVCRKDATIKDGTIRSNISRARLAREIGGSVATLPVASNS